MSFKAWLSKKITKNKILCEACSHACVLEENQYGKCGVRRVEDGELRLLVYAKVVALNIDPIEKKPMFHFLPSSSALSLGTVGCNFSCKFCQNHQISQYPHEHNHEIIGRELSPTQIVNLAIEHKCKSIAYTYNEPIIFFEYTYDVAKLAHEKGIKNIYVTSGYETHKSIDLLSEYIDGMNIDIKSFSNDFYKNICGARLKPVLNTINYAYKKGIWIEVTTLIIEGKNDSDDEIRDIARFLAAIDKYIPWHLSAFHPMYKMQNIDITSSSTLHKACKIAKQEGLLNVYVGNIDDEDFESTYCPKCKNKVISRSGYIGKSVDNKLDDGGKCPYCNCKIDGVWL